MHVSMHTFQIHFLYMRLLYIPYIYIIPFAKGSSLNVLQERKHVRWRGFEATCTHAVGPITRGKVNANRTGSIKSKARARARGNSCALMSAVSELSG